MGSANDGSADWCGMCGLFVLQTGSYSSLERVESKMESREGERHGEYFQEDT